MSSFKGNKKRQQNNNDYDKVLHDKSLSAGAKLIYIILAARGKPRSQDQITQDLDDLMLLFSEAQHDLSFER